MRIAPILLALTTACEQPPSPEATGLPAELAAPPLALSVGTVLPGQPLHVSVDGVPPGSRTYVVAGSGIGPGPCPPAAGGACLDVVGATLIGSAVADASGFAHLTVRVPTSVHPAAPLAFQAVALRPGLSASPPLASSVTHPDTVCPSAGGNGWPSASAAWECEVLQRINAARAAGRDCGSAGYFGPTHPLTMVSELRYASRVHTQWMVDTGVFSHNSPGGPLGDNMGERAANAGYAPSALLKENLGSGQANPRRVLDSWFASHGHCSNLMSPAITDVGVGFAVNAQGRELWTAKFGRLR